MRKKSVLTLLMFGVIVALTPLLAQPPQEPGDKDKEKGPPPFGGPMGGKRSVLGQFDQDGDGKLNKQERTAGREFLKKNNAGRGFFGKGGFGKGKQEPAKPGPKVSPADVKNFPEGHYYDPLILRTIFLQFEDDDWESELTEFYRTDVEVPAKLMVDGKSIGTVGVHFRGASSFFTVSAGYKRSFGISVDAFDSKLRLYGNKSLNLLNAHDDPTFMGTVLYSQISSQRIPTPKANWVRVVINGESWGIYVNAQQFDRQFVSEHYKGGQGERWHVTGNPGSGAGLRYLGENLDDYKRRYQIKSPDDEKSWKALAALCKALDKTPAEQLASALKPILDVDALLWFLAIDNAAINCDGYWIRGSDFNIYRDNKKRFHIVPHDFNECFRSAMGPGFGMPGGMRFKDKDKEKAPGDLPNEPPKDQIKSKDDPPPDRPKGKDGERPRGGNINLDPLIGLTDNSKPLRSKLLAVPEFREQYLKNMHAIAHDSFDWKNVGPMVATYRTLIEKEVEADTRKLYSMDAFRALTSDNPEGGIIRREGGAMNFRQFFDQRRKYLLEHSEVKKAAAD